MDTGGIDPTKGKDQPAFDRSKAFIQETLHAERAMEEADLILFIVDGQAGITPADQESPRFTPQTAHRRGATLPTGHPGGQQSGKRQIRQVAADFYQLGLGDPYAISALHGTGTGDLLDEVVRYIAEFG